MLRMKLRPLAIGVLLLNPLSSPATTVAYDVLLGRPTDTSVTTSVLASNDLQVYLEYGNQSGVYTSQTTTNALTNGTPSPPASAKFLLRLNKKLEMPVFMG